MGYSITIGEATINIDKEISTEVIRLDNAPAFGEPTDHTNERWPSYTSWHDFCVFTGLEVYNKTLINEHPGFQVLTEKHRTQLQVLIEKYRDKYPNVKPTFDDELPENKQMCRLVWLEFWIDWALTNCKKPIITNR